MEIPFGSVLTVEVPASDDAPFAAVCDHPQAYFQIKAENF